MRTKPKFEDFELVMMSCFECLFSNSGYKIIQYGDKIFAYHGRKNAKADYGWTFGYSVERGGVHYKSFKEAKKACKEHFNNEART